LSAMESAFQKWEKRFWGGRAKKGPKKYKAKKGGGATNKGSDDKLRKKEIPAKLTKTVRGSWYGLPERGKVPWHKTKGRYFH